MAASKIHISAGYDEQGTEHSWCCRQNQECIGAAKVREAALGKGYQDWHDACSAAGVDCKPCAYNFSRAQLAGGIAERFADSPG